MFIEENKREHYEPFPQWLDFFFCILYIGKLFREGYKHHHKVEIITSWFLTVLKIS